MPLGPLSAALVLVCDSIAQRHIVLHLEWFDSCPCGLSRSMASVVFLETLAVVSITLGSVVAAIVVALPSILPKALRLVDRDLARERLGRRPKTSAKASSFSRLRRAFLTTQQEFLEGERSGMQTSVRDGALSAVAFLTCGLACLLLLLLPYTVVDGVPYVFLSGFGQALIAVPFVVGFAFLLFLASTFYSAIKLSLGFPIRSVDQSGP